MTPSRHAMGAGGKRDRYAVGDQVGGWLGWFDCLMLIGLIVRLI